MSNKLHGTNVRVSPLSSPHTFLPVILLAFLQNDCTCIYTTHAHARAHKHTNTHIHTHKYTHMRAHTHTHTHTHTHIHTHTRAVVSGTELERRGADFLNSKLWSAKLLCSEKGRDMIQNVHLNYLR